MIYTGPLFSQCAIGPGWDGQLFGKSRRGVEMVGGLVDCPMCQGLKKIGCPNCGGSGILRKRHEESAVETPCPACHGNGVCQCTACQGTGFKQVVPF